MPANHRLKSRGIAWFALIALGLTVAVVVVVVGTGGGSRSGEAPADVPTSPSAVTDVVLHLPPTRPDTNPVGGEPRATLIRDLAAVPPLQGGGVPLAAARCEPSGTKFPEGLQVTWPLSHPRSPGAPLSIVVLDAARGQWLPTGEAAVVGPSGRDATGRVYHFSDLGVSDVQSGFAQGTDGACYVTPNFIVYYEQSLPVFNRLAPQLEAVSAEVERAVADLRALDAARNGQPVPAADVTAHAEKVTEAARALQRQASLAEGMAQRLRTQGKAAEAAAKDAEVPPLRDRQKRLELLAADLRTIAATLPQGGAGWAAADVEKFRGKLTAEVQARRTDFDPKSLGYVRQVGEEMERIRARYVGWGFRVPPYQRVDLFPRTHGWDHMVGHAEKSIRPQTEGQATIAGHLQMGLLGATDMFVPFSHLRTVLAHEYFHRVQMQYYVAMAPGEYLREGTAALMELLVYPEHARANAEAFGSLRPKLSTVCLTDQADSAAAFFLFLHDAYGAGGGAGDPSRPPQIIRWIWEKFLDRTNFTAQSAIEQVVGNKQTLPGLFHEFADAFYTGDPARDPKVSLLFPILRKDRFDANGALTFRIIEQESLADVQEYVAPPRGLEQYTAIYKLYDRATPADIEVTVDATTQTLVRLYSVGPDGTTYVASASRPGPFAETIPVGGGRKIGVLLSCTFDRPFDETARGIPDGSAQLSFRVKQRPPRPGAPTETGFKERDAGEIDERFRAGAPNWGANEDLRSDRKSITAVTQRGNEGFQTNRLNWEVSREDSPADALKRIAVKSRQFKEDDAPEFVQQNRLFQVKDRGGVRPAEVIRHQEARLKQGGDLGERVVVEIDSYAIYRDVFVIRYHRRRVLFLPDDKPQALAAGMAEEDMKEEDFLAERAAMLKKTQELIDRRFPAAGKVPS